MSRRVIALVEDMFFAAKIRGTAESGGVRIQFARSIESVCELASTEPTSLIIADLHARCCDPFDLAERLRSDDRFNTITLLGFFSHVQKELQKRAEQAGYHRVLPRSAFNKHLSQILDGTY